MASAGQATQTAKNANNKSRDCTRSPRSYAKSRQWHGSLSDGEIHKRLLLEGHWRPLAYMTGRQNAHS